jgi:hypothetical protein
MGIHGSAAGFESCESGVDTENDNPVNDFTASNIWAVDDDGFGV